MRFKHADGIDSDNELLVKRKEHHNTTYLVKVLGAAKVDQLQDAAWHNQNVSTFNVSAGKNRE